MNIEDIRETIEYSREQGAPADQQMVIALLREVQEAENGVLTQDVLEMIAGEYAVKVSMLQAMIRRVPDLRYESMEHRLEICGTCRTGARLRDFIERTYGVNSGAANAEFGFLYRVTPCMKNCKNGPSVRWDGKLYGNADEKLIRQLIGNRRRKS